MFLAAFVLGLVLNVVLIIRGTERWTRQNLSERLDDFGRELRLGRISLLTPVAASLLSAFGLTGYLLQRFTAWPTWIIWLLAFAGAGAAVSTAIAVVHRWAVPHALRDQPDERFVLQGQLARVVESIPYRGTGVIAYRIDATEFRTPANSVDDSPIEAGTDVVIERVEDGVVFVEDWARVELRL